MLMARYFLSVLLVLQIFFSDARASDKQEEVSFPLLRSIQEVDEEIEACHYYKKDSKIKFQGDIVYGPEYNNLNEDIDKQLGFVTACSEVNSSSIGQYNSHAVNFLTAILSVTGHKEGGSVNKRKRLYTPLCIRDGEASSQGGKIAIFSSADFDGKSKSFSLQNFLEWLPKVNSEKNVKRFRNYKKYAFFNLNSEDLPQQFLPSEEDYLKNERHTEPLCLNALLSLPKTAFQNILPKEYILDYYEIHLISVRDACGDCVLSLYKSIPTLKGYFSNPNLFMFFHSQVPDAPYSIRYEENLYAKGVFSYEHFNVYPSKEWLINLKKEKKKPLLKKAKSKGNFGAPLLSYIGILNYIDSYDTFDLQ